MGERSSYAPGTFCWADLATSDADGATSFYAQLFGWETRAMPVGDGGSYVMCFLGGRDVAALYASTEPGAPHWTSYVSVEEVDAVAGRVESLGGALLSEPFDVFDQGRMAVLRDPAGAVLALWQPRGHAGAGLVNAPGALTWNDLVAPDPEPAVPFYSELLGWEIARLAPEYAAIANRGAKNGGVLTQPGGPSYWLTYFASDDLDASLAKAAELGGGTLVGPLTVPSGARFAVARDPQGAVFGLLSGPLDP